MGAQLQINYANNMTYKGQVKEKVPWGKGTVSFEDGSIIEGQFNKGTLQRGKLTCQQFVYDGQFKKGKICGRGVLTDTSNVMYDGEFKGGKFVNGSITSKNNKGQQISRYVGSINEDGKTIAQGSFQVNMLSKKDNTMMKCYHKSQGTFNAGLLEGKGQHIYQNGDTYEGPFCRGKRSGEGIYKGRGFQLDTCFAKSSFSDQTIVTFANGDKFQGKTTDGLFDGFGTYTYKDGSVYEGDFYCGQMWGQCKITYPSGGQIQSYEGQVNNGIYNGIGIIYYNNGVIFKGNFMDGVRNGFGVLIYGNKKYKCLFVMNKLVGQLKEFD